MPKMNVTNARNCLFMFKTNKQIGKSARKRTVTGILNQCKQKQRALYCELCISLLTKTTDTQPLVDR